MKIILKKEVANLGEAGDVVEVKTGYALNYLVPQGFAAVGTPSALKQHAETLRQRAHKEAKLVADAQALAAAGIEMDKKNITVPEIKELGEFEGKAKCYKGVFSDVKINVVAE